MPNDRQFGADVLLLELQGLVVGDWVSFDMQRNQNGQPQELCD